MGFAEHYSKRAFDAFEDPSKRCESDLIYMINQITNDDKDLIREYIVTIYEFDFIYAIDIYIYSDILWKL